MPHKPTNVPADTDRTQEMIETIEQSLRHEDMGFKGPDGRLVTQETDPGVEPSVKDPAVISLPGKVVSDSEMQLGPPLKSNHNEKQLEIIDAFKYAWAEYKASAWGMDEVKPVSHSSSTWFNLGLTIVDSLDTMWLMGLEEEFAEAKLWVERDLNLAQKKDVNLFEVTIRVLGGLLSAYHLTKDEIFLDKAVCLLLE